MIIDHLNSGASRIALKLDTHNAFDKLNWSFLFKTIIAMGFSLKFVVWVRSCIPMSMISVKINGALEGYFN